MGFPLLFLVISLVLACDAFLLDDRTKPTTTSGPLLSDQHYNFLINLIMNARQTRVKLEQHVVRLEQELLATQQGVTDIYHTSSINNVTLEQEAKNWKTIRIENNDLKKKIQFTELEVNQMQYEIQTYKFNQSVTFKHFQENLTSVENIQNLSVGKLDLEIHNMSNRGTKGLARLDFYKKDERIGLIYFSVTAGNSFQTSTISTVQFLDKHDTYYIKAGTNIALGGDTYSCISFLQLTNG
ncbi:unnamed protein product [Mytilus edulis]|uniref:Uncharacterized protein n=1 Tax=Mytilus edulis TaxID=6550 RepID=A0A8S3PUQ4_MYTED|nr:unnamed protein product [Mytilus edulis]